MLIIVDVKAFHKMFFLIFNKWQSQIFMISQVAFGQVIAKYVWFNHNICANYKQFYFFRGAKVFRGVIFYTFSDVEAYLIN